MQAMQINTAANKLLKALGPKAIAEAAQKAVKFEKRGDIEHARDWRQIENTLIRLQGPPST